ncbi:MAG: hypothetical protein U0800_08520 [Isosphaeraceae bacterium]
MNAETMLHTVRRAELLAWQIIEPSAPWPSDTVCEISAGDAADGLAYLLAPKLLPYGSSEAERERLLPDYLALARTGAHRAMLKALAVR